MEQLKEIKQPLGLYDVFGYILPGFFFFSLILIETDLTPIIERFINNDPNLIVKEELFSLKIYKYFFYMDGITAGLIPFIILLIFSYISGHIIASFSSFISKHFIKRFLKNPSENLFSDTNSELPPDSKTYKFFKLIYYFLKNKIGAFLNLNYKKPFSVEIQKNIKNKIENCFGFKVNTKDYYWLTYSYLCTNANYMTRRVQHFINLSGFARNIAGSLILYILIRIILIIILVFNAKNLSFNYSIFILLSFYSLITSSMIWTYLRLHKRQAYDMFYIFLSLDLNTKNQEGK
jgi:hypothetical protein